MVRRRAISGLVRMGDPAALPALENAMKSKTPALPDDELAVRNHARDGIERLKHPDRSR
jgi:HEAT repeat protein